MRRTVVAWVIALVAQMLINAPAGAAERVALVIGNAAYAHVDKLANPVNDARAMAAALQKLGFEVSQAEDLTKSGLEAALRDFARQARGTEIALVYFSGHGLEVGGVNYVVPVDARLESDVDVDLEAVSLDVLMRVVDGANGLRLIILDACRNNPFAAQMQMTSQTRSVGRGLRVVEPAAQTLVAYAAKAGTTADDGSGGHSPFTAALLERITTPGLEVSYLFREVRDEVLGVTGRVQEPFTYGSLGAERYYLAGEASQSPIAQTTAVPTAPVNDHGAEVAFWETIKDSRKAAAFEAYLEKFPDGTFAPLARLKIDELHEELPVEQAALTEPEVPSSAASGGDRGLGVVTQCDRLAAHPADRAAVASGVVFEQIDAPAAISACRAALQDDPNNIRLSYQLGRALEAGKQFQEAVANYRAAAEKKYIRAQVAMGYAYGEGKGVPRDAAESVRWFRLAADNKDPIAQYYVGWSYESGDGMEKNEAEAARWYRLAAEQGFAGGQVALGELYDTGKGVAKDDAEAARWYRLAAEQGDPAGQTALGLLYALGEGVTKDPAEAARLYRMAAEQGHGPGQVNLALMYRDGKGVVKDYAESARLSRLAAEQGESAGQINLGVLYYNGTGVRRDRVEAAYWFALGAAQGSDLGKTNLKALSRSELVRAAQTWLNRLGGDLGAPDGALGKRTRNAITVFQKDHDLEMTGDVSVEFLIELAKALRG